MIRLADVFDAASFEEAKREGWIVQREHPTEPLAILNYTDAATYARAWTPCTIASRGLIYRPDTGEVVARPFTKFFNYGESSAPTLDLSAPVVVTDKLDGSLGVLYPTAAGHAVATRGSFVSEQAIHATEVWRERYRWAFDPPAGWTVLFEIVYPGNRIVVDYGATDDLILLGAVEIATGDSIDPYHPSLAGWPGPRATIFDHDTLADALAAEPRKNAEGVVVHFVQTGERVKVKQEDYVALHRIVTGLNERTVWEHLRAGNALDDLIAPLPDEFHDWTRAVAYRLIADVDERASDVEHQYATIAAALPDGFTRKDYALLVAPHPLRSHLFARLDGKDYRPALWDAVKPEAMKGPRGMIADAA